MHEDFLNQVRQGWFSPFQHSEATKFLTAKFKNLWKILTEWKKSLSSLSSLKENIANVKLVLVF